MEREKEKEVTKLKEIAVVNGIYRNSLDEEKSENILNERKTNLMESLINIYENNFNKTKDIINNLTNYFNNHSLNDYKNNKENILMVSSIIKMNQTLNLYIINYFLLFIYII